MKWCLNLGRGALCVQMDFKQTFDAITKCNDKDQFWSHFYKLLVIFKYHIRPWDNIFDTDICRSINISKKAKYHFSEVINVSRNVCVKDIVSGSYFMLKNYQHFIEMTSNIIHIVALGVGYKCPHKIHLSTQWGGHCVLKCVLWGHFLGIKMPQRN